MARTCSLLDGLGTCMCMYYAMNDVTDMGQQIGYCSLEWNWPLADEHLLGPCLLLEPRCLNFIVHSSIVKSQLFFLVCCIILASGIS